MRIFIAGQEGMVGSAIYKLLKRKNYFIIDCKRKDLDLTDQSKTRLWFKKKTPDVVINAAGKVAAYLITAFIKRTTFILTLLLDLI